MISLFQHKPIQKLLRLFLITGSHYKLHRSFSLSFMYIFYIYGDRSFYCLMLFFHYLFLFSMILILLSISQFIKHRLRFGLKVFDLLFYMLFIYTQFIYKASSPFQANLQHLLSFYFFYRITSSKSMSTLSEQVAIPLLNSANFSTSRFFYSFIQPLQLKLPHSIQNTLAILLAEYFLSPHSQTPQSVAVDAPIFIVAFLSYSFFYSYPCCGLCLRPGFISKAPPLCFVTSQLWSLIIKQLAG